MFRALLELVVTIILAMAARAILRSFMKGFANASRNGFGQTPPQGSPKDSSQYEAPPQTKAPPREKVPVAGELHKDPICGMYVSEATRFQRRSGRESFYYCSEECKDKHAMAAR